MEEPNFWDDAEKASASMKEVKDLKSVVERADGLSQEYEDILTSDRRWEMRKRMPR